jgi:hypothetical protein
MKKNLWPKVNCEIIKKEKLSQYFPDDCLWLLRNMSVNLLKNKLMFFSQVGILVALTFLTLFQTVLFLQRFDGYYFIKYLAVYAASYYVSSTALSNGKY